MEKEKLRIIEKIINVSEDNVSPFAEKYLNALYEIIVNEDYLMETIYDEFDIQQRYVCKKCYERFYKFDIDKFKGETND